MNKLLKAAVALVCAVGLHVCARAQMTTITATSIQMKGAPIQTGTVTFIPVNQTGQPVPITAGGSLYDAQGFTASITNGVVADGFQVPDSCTASPVTANTHLSYSVQVYNSTTKQSFTLQHVTGVCGASWDLDSYVPTQNAVVASTGLVSGSTVPAHCSNTSIFYKQSSPPQLYTCVSGSYLFMSGSSIAVPNSGILKADGAGGIETAVEGTDYATPASVQAASDAAAAAQSMADSAIPATQKAVANGVATLDANGKVPVGQIPSNLANSGLLADYQFADGTGTTVTDSSGNGNNATFISGHNPSWAQNGLQFTTSTQGVNLPSALNAGETFEITSCVDALPSSGGQPKNNQYPLFITSSLGFSGLNLLYAGAGQNSPYALGVVAGSATRSAASQTFSGCHVITYVLGTGSGNLDHLYIDGVELSYTSEGSSAGFQASGNLILGNSGISPYNGSGIIGTVYRLRVLSSQLTAGQAYSDAIALRAAASARGISLSPPQYLLNTPQMHLIGDSITCAWNGSACNSSYSWGSQLSLTNQPTYTITNWGIYGAYMSAMVSSEPWRVSPYCKTQAGPAIAINFAGTNDLRILTASQLGQYAAAMAQLLKNAGCDPFIMTVLSRTGNSSISGTPTNDAQKNAYDALVSAQWKSWGYKGLLDVGADPLIGADGQGANTTYFLDGTHPTATSQGLIAAAASRALNYYYSQYSPSNPHVISAGTTLTTADAAVSIASPTAAVPLVMPDCIGPTGAMFVISNPQSAQPVTVAGGSASEPINGLTTPITIPANSTVTLTDVANPRSTAGCHWVM